MCNSYRFSVQKRLFGWLLVSCMLFVPNVQTVMLVTVMIVCPCKFDIYYLYHIGSFWMWAKFIKYWNFFKVVLFLRMWAICDIRKLDTDAWTRLHSTRNSELSKVIRNCRVQTFTKAMIYFPKTLVCATKFGFNL